MKQPYRMDEGAFVHHLNEAYGIAARRLIFIPYGDSAYSYRVEGENGTRYYLKLFDHGNDSHGQGILRCRRYVPLMWELHQTGRFMELPCPFRTLSGAFLLSFSGCTAVLFQFIEGETWAEAYPFSKHNLERVGRLAAQIRQLTPWTIGSGLLSETYDVSFSEHLNNCLQLLEHLRPGASPASPVLRELVIPQQTRITGLLHLLTEIRARLVLDPAPQVLCHGDLWGGNLMETADGRLIVLDWEAAMLAPPELDIVGYIGDGLDHFLTGYEQELGQPMELNPDLLRFYAYRHHLRNLTHWCLNILHRDLEPDQLENDLEMVRHHCLNRLDTVEASLLDAADRNI
ncbi:thiamine kinase-like enzyme [Paenibacillus rhizosphaerae]|uniref:Thiamine kinase-like enzyme n=1 Tax=Paenibacillus rhizosphaerae TaxID=297318 RepID=A0A839TK45_9BACL|nr:aminoglycoside phosphotransferase family protein [Paenibacillus rhizosphaerae]MBB3127012.1 thiamine kinase-like enzyme [Paenibacillus rhizosphaerae]